MPEGLEYRNHIAREAKLLPHEEKREFLELEKNNPEYWRARMEKMEHSNPYSPVEGAYSEEEAERFNAAQGKFLKAEIERNKESSVHDISSEAIAETLRAGLSGVENARVVDIGCGARVDFLEKWKTSGNVAMVIGIEASDHMRKFIEESSHDASIHVQPGDWLNTRLPKETADMAVSRFSFQHVQNIDSAYEELARILKPNGRAVIALPHPRYCEEELKRQGVTPENRSPMTVQVLEHPLNYFYHTLEDYFDCEAFQKHFRLVNSKAGDWKTGRWDLKEGATPNTLVFEIEKIA